MINQISKKKVCQVYLRPRRKVYCKKKKQKEKKGKIRKYRDKKEREKGNEIKAENKRKNK